MNRQLSMRGIYDPSLPVECSGPELGDTIKAVELAGFTVQDLQGVTFAALVVALNAAAFSLR